MRLNTIQEALASKLHLIIEKTKDGATGEKTEVEKKAIPSDLYALFKGRNRDKPLGVETYEDYFRLVCSMLNYGLSPSPAPFDDRLKATLAAANLKTQNALYRLLESASTHVLKFLDSGLPGESLINNIPSTGQGCGVSIDTISSGTVFNMGKDAKDLFASPYWLSEFTLPSGVITSHLEVLLYGTDPQLHAWIPQALTDLGIFQVYPEWLAVVAKFKEAPVEDVHGKLIRFPIGENEYLTISPVPSATLTKRLSDRFFVAFNERTALPKGDLAAHQFDFPASVVVEVGGANPQNCGTLGTDIGGKARALHGRISELPQGGNGSHEGQLLRKLSSGGKTLLTFPNYILKFLRSRPEVNKHRRNWERYMTEAIAESTSDLLMLRSEGLPIPADRARFRFPIERDFVMRGLEGDVGNRSLTPGDLHAMALHIRDQFLYAARSSNKTLVLDQSQSDLIYQVAIDHLR
ncbi:hypothetical protein IFT69_18540 [Pseudomonas putida]|nr:hypothetical protein [Pseudomonas putida]